MLKQPLPKKNISFPTLRDVAIEVELQRYSKLKAAVLAASTQKDLEEVKVPFRV